MISQVARRSPSDVDRVFPCGVKIGKSSYGLGVFSFAFIPKGTPIGRVPGEIVHDADYGSDYCINAGEGKVLEPGPPFCYLNHSCEPNCQLMHYVREEDADGEELEVGALTVTEMEDDEEAFVDTEPEEDDESCFFGEGGASEIDEDADESFEEEFEDEEDVEMQFEDDIDAEIWVESTRDILPGEELTIDYAWPADRAFKCLCGSPNCRGWIVDPAELDELSAEKTAI